MSTNNDNINSQIIRTSINKYFENLSKEIDLSQNIEDKEHDFEAMLSVSGALDIPVLKVKKYFLSSLDERDFLNKKEETIKINILVCIMILFSILIAISLLVSEKFLKIEEYYNFSLINTFCYHIGIVFYIFSFIVFIYNQISNILFLYKRKNSKKILYEIKDNFFIFILLIVSFSAYLITFMFLN